MVKHGGGHYSGWAVDEKLQSHLEWPYGVLMSIVASRWHEQLVLLFDIILDYLKG